MGDKKKHFSIPYVKIGTKDTTNWGKNKLF